MFIDGKWCEAERNKSFLVYNPFNNEEIGRVPDGDEKDALKAIDAATKAFEIWSKTSEYQRSSILYEAYKIMLDEKENLAVLMTKEQGKPIKAARNEVQYGADFLLWYAEEAKRIYGKTIPAPRSDQRFIIKHQPIGVVGAITPWNYPVSMVTRKIAPALAAGCTIVLKPAEATPLCAMAVFKIFEKAGLPEGVINLVTAENPAPIGDILISDKRVKKITFTGSTVVGKKLAEGAARQMKRISMELGGHAPFIVCKDADPVIAAKGAVLVKFLNTGQACISPNRIYVHKDQVDAFLGEFKKRVSAMKAGDGLEPGVSIGPLVNASAVQKVENQVNDAVKKGASVVTGGKRLIENSLKNGCFYAPTILSGVTTDMAIYREETFGPVAPIITYDDQTDLLKLANDTDYGLAAYVYTNSLSIGMKMFEGLNFGIIGINDINPTAAAAPFGGMKESGIGREGGTEGIAEYLETKLGGFSLR